MASGLTWRVLCVLAVVTSAGCASIPFVEEPSVAAAQPVAMRGSKGPLSARETRRVLRRVAAAAPNATALERHLAIEQAVARTPLYTGNETRILRDGAETFGAMFAAIRAAQHYVLLEYYILEDVSESGQSLSDLLIEKQKSGVEICIIYDSIGSLATPGDFFARLRDAGVKIAEFNSPNPIRGGNPFAINDRDHRKIFVADGSLAIIGGVNLSHTYQSAPSGGSSGGSRKPSNSGAARAQPPQPGAANDAQAANDTQAANDPQTRDDPQAANEPQKTNEPQEAWHDTDLQLRGPVVHELERLYRQQWDALRAPQSDSAAPAQIADAGDEVVRIIGSDPSARRSPFYIAIISAIRSAESRIWITAAYFGPTFQQMHVLLNAARRGVDVRILVPSHSDSAPALAVQRSHYSSLLRNGVRVFEWSDGISHTKAAVIDGVWCVTGSSNFDQRSVLFNDEVDAIVLGRDTASRYETLFTGWQSRAKEITAAEWRKRSMLERAREQFWRLWQRLL